MCQYSTTTQKANNNNIFSILILILPAYVRHLHQIIKKVSVLSILQKKNDFGRSLQKLVADKHVLAFGFIQLNTKSCRKFSKITLAIPAATTEYVMYGGIFQRLLTSSHVYCMLHTHYTCTM